MLFKQLQLFQLDAGLNASFINSLEEKLASYAYQPCLPTMPHSAGWVPPIEQEGDESLLRVINGFAVICLQIEEKILPSSVIYQNLQEAVKEIETTQNRKIRSKEKMALKDDIVMSLMPRAFSKFTRIYAYIDITNHWLVLGLANAKKTDLFLSAFKKSITDDIHPITVNHLSSMMTGWLTTQPYAPSFAIEKSCALQDPKQENRTIRCKNQDLFAPGIQALIKDGCHAIQLALSWNDRVQFVLTNTLALSSIQFQDELLKEASEVEAETKQQQFDADMFIMTGTFSNMLTDLLGMLKQATAKSDSLAAVA